MAGDLCREEKNPFVMQYLCVFCGKSRTESSWCKREECFTRVKLGLQSFAAPGGFVAARNFLTSRELHTF